MFGGLYNKDEYEEEEVVEHTMQFCFIFITITMIWEKPIELKNTDFLKEVAKHHKEWVKTVTALGGRFLLRRHCSRDVHKAVQIRGR